MYMLQKFNNSNYRNLHVISVPKLRTFVIFKLLLCAMLKIAFWPLALIVLHITKLSNCKILIRVNNTIIW